MQTLQKNYGFYLFIGILIVIGVMSLSTSDNSFTPFAAHSDVSSNADDRDDIEALYIRAREFDANGDLEEAIIRYSDIIKRDPTDSVAYYQRCWLHYRLSHYNQAISDCDQAIELNPTYVNAWAMRCYTYQDMEEYERAIDECTQTIGLDSSHAGAFGARADAYRYLGDYDQALADYNRSLELDPYDGVTYNNRALLHRDMGNDELALADYNSSIKYYDPKSDYGFYITWRNRGRLHASLGNYDQAIYDFRKSIDLNPTYIRAIVSLAELFETLERYPQSLELYETVVRLEENGVSESDYDTSYIPDRIDYIEQVMSDREAVVGEYNDLLTEARENHIRGNYDSAIELYTGLLENVDYVEVYYWRGQAYDENKQYAEAIIDYDAYLNRASEDDENYHYEVEYRLDNLRMLDEYNPDAVERYLEAQAIQYEDPEQAISLYTEAIELDASLLPVYQNRAWLYRYDRFDWEAALVDYQTYAALAEDPEAYGYDMLMLEKMIALPDAAKDCLRAIEDYYQNYDVILTTEERINRYTCVIEHAPDYVPAYRERAELYEGDYQYVEAVADYEMYLRLVASDEELSAFYDSYDEDSDYDSYSYYETPQYVESTLAYLSVYVTLPPDVLDQWVTAERAYYSEADDDAALESLTQVLDSQPDFAEAYSIRGQIYYSQGDYENALADFQAYVDFVGEDDTYYQNMLISEIEHVLTFPEEIQGMYQEAKQASTAYDYETMETIYSQIIESYPDFADAYYQRGVAYQSLAKFDEALADFEMYVSLAGEENFYREELEWQLEYLQTVVETESATDPED